MDNYCRNINGSALGPFCYTSGGTTALCDIPYCPQSDQAIVLENFEEFFGDCNCEETFEENSFPENILDFWQPYHQCRSVKDQSSSSCLHLLYQQPATSYVSSAFECALECDNPLNHECQGFTLRITHLNVLECKLKSCQCHMNNCNDRNGVVYYKRKNSIKQYSRSNVINLPYLEIHYFWQGASNVAISTGTFQFISNDIMIEKVFPSKYSLPGLT